MRYFGSKTSTIETVHSLVSARVSSGTFCDVFGGIGSVGSYFRSKGYTVWSGDILRFAYYFQIARLRFSELHFQTLRKVLGYRNNSEILQHLNALQPKDGWFVREYSKNRQFFLEQNAKKIQACRLEIKNWSRSGYLDHEEHAILLAALINSMDKVANTAGTYYAYLKHWHKKAMRNFHFDFVENVSMSNPGICFNESADQLVERNCFDILYLDPPYNSRSYCHYYHLPETIATEATPHIHGKSGIPDRVKGISQYNKASEAKNALSALLIRARFKLGIFHYADDGLIKPDDAKSILSKFGTVEDFFLDSKGYTTKYQPRTFLHHLYLVNNV